MDSDHILVMVLGLAVLGLLGFSIHGCQSIGRECVKAGNEWSSERCLVRDR